MKKNGILLLTLLTLANTGTIAYIYWKTCMEPVPRHRSPEGYTPSFRLPSDVFLPDTFQLAGEPVPLARWDVSEAFRRELITNTYLHASTIRLLKNAPRYFGRIVPILKEEGVPEDFKYLAVIESNLNPLAVSPAGAVGIWQFMRATGKEYGLEVNDEVDERYHLEKSTRAACQYLKKAYERFGSWTLAAASYNGGMNGIIRQIDIQREKYYYNLLLGEETDRYVFRILALKQIMEHPEIYHFTILEPYPEEPFTTVRVNRSVKELAEFANEQGISYKTLKRFNPWLRKPSLKVGKNRYYDIAIPEKRENYR